MAKEPPKLKVIWKEAELPDSAERLAAAFEMLLGYRAPEEHSQGGGLDSERVPDNDQIANPQQGQSQ